MTYKSLFVILVTALTLTGKVRGHAALLDPPARNVMWRMGFPEVPFHIDDDYLICTETESKHCPPCGDSAEEGLPRDHEAGGPWATGIIAKTYTVGQVIDIYVNVTISHGGFMEFKICPNNDVNKAVDQRCLDQYLLQVVGQRTTKVKLTAPFGSKEDIKIKLKLPSGLTCTQCVLQMSHLTEQFLPDRVMFRNCADVAIVNDSTFQGIHPPSGFGSPNLFRRPEHASSFQRSRVDASRFTGQRETFPSRF